MTVWRTTRYAKLIYTKLFSRIGEKHFLMFRSVISSKLWTICFVNMLIFGQIHTSLDYDHFKYKNNAIDKQTLEHCLQTLLQRDFLDFQT